MAVQAELSTYSFPPPPSGDTIEWPGTPIGLSNTITRTKGRTSKSDKNLDANPDLKAEVLRATREAGDQAEREGTLLTADVIIHGIRVRAFTNSPHLIDFWQDNWYSPDDWERATEAAPPVEPRVTVYAFGGVDQEEAAYYSYDSDTIVFFNTAYYGQLKSWVLGAVGRVLAREYGIHSIHSACVEAMGRGIMYIAPTGTGKSTSSYGLMTLPDARFHSDDWVYVHYAYATATGDKVSPFEIRAGDEVVHGYECFPWLREHPRTSARAWALRLDGREVELDVSELDLDAGPRAYGYISEKVFYLRTNLVESFPASAPEILRSKMENVPDVEHTFVEEHQEVVQRVVAAVEQGPDDAFDAASAGRLFAFDNSRAMLDIANVFGEDRVYLNPMEPVRLDDVFLLQRDPESDVVLCRLTEEQFMDRLILGLTPQGKREVAYNAYRAVNDPEERSYIDALLAEGGGLWSALSANPDKPVTLDEEFTLFETLYRSTKCYQLNTILAHDPRVQDKAEAVDLTIRLIARVVEQGAPRDALTIDNYRELTS